MGWGAAASALAGPFTSMYLANRANEISSADAMFNYAVANEQSAWERNFNERSLRAQIEFAKNGIRWRAADAEAAGIHPLAALGVSPGSGPSIQVGTSTPRFDRSRYMPDLSSMGADISNAVRASMSVEDRTRSDMELQLIQSQIDENDARKNYYVSLANRNAQTDVERSPFPSSAGAVTIQPVRQMSRDPTDSSRVAGNHASWQRTEVVPGKFLDLPYSEGEGPWESLEGFLPQAITLYKNLIYNPKKDFMTFLRSSAPDLFRLTERWRQINRDLERSERIRLQKIQSTGR